MAEQKPATKPTPVAPAPPPTPAPVAPGFKKAPKIKSRVAKKRRTIKTLPFRRRRINVTDYKSRLRLLSSNRPRLVARITSRRVIAQLVVSEKNTTQDRTVVSADSKELKRFGLKEWSKNTGACYLTGFLCARRAASAGFGEAILDVGLRAVTKGGRLLAILKGALDGGLNIPHGAENFPNEKRIEERLGEELKKIRASIEAESGLEKEKKGDKDAQTKTHTKTRTETQTKAPAGARKAKSEM